MTHLPYPRLALIADGFTDPERAERAVAAVRAGVRWVHARDHAASPDAFASAAERFQAQLHAADPDVVVTVNRHPDVAAALGASLHVGRRGPSVQDVRATLRTDAMLGYSAHEQVEAQSERKRHVDYFFFSPVYPTTSKPDHPGAGTAALKAFCQTASPVPVFALGGITPERITACLDVGAEGVAVLSGIMDATAPAAAARAYLRALGV